MAIDLLLAEKLVLVPFPCRELGKAEFDCVVLDPEAEAILVQIIAVGDPVIDLEGIVRNQPCTETKRLLGLEQSDPFTTGRIEVLEDALAPSATLDALVQSVRGQANRVIELSPNTPDEAAQVLNSITSPSALADFLAANLQAFMEAVLRARPSAAKGTYVRSVTVSSTMGPGVRLDPQGYHT